MTELLTAAQMRAIEAAAIASGEVTGLDLMERAGKGVVEAVFSEWPELRAGSFRAVVLCGPGNNGGDGFVVARLLKEWGWEVLVCLYGNPEKLPPDARVNYDRWSEMAEVEHVHVPFDLEGLQTEKRILDFAKADKKSPLLVVEALFGTGLSRPIHAKGDNDLIMLMVNLDDLWMDGGPTTYGVAIDMPTGVCADSGKILRLDDTADPTFYDEIADDPRFHAFVALLTVTFHSLKPGHLLAEGPRMCGKLCVVDIGLGHRNPRLNTVEPPHRLAIGKINGHKFSYGHALILSGPAGHGGAARLTSRGALRIGAGLVTLACPPEALAENAARLDAIMLKTVADGAGLAAILSDIRINALCLGPGLGLDGRASELVRAALVGQVGVKPRPTVLDADALTLIARDASLFASLHPQCVLTPHGGEFARLCPEIAAKLEAPATHGPAYSKVDATREAAARANCTVLFKGPDTVIASPDGTCAINSAAYDRAAPWLATAGSGDVLAGFITGLLARGFTPQQAAETGAWLHVEAARSFGPGLIAEDLADELPKVFRHLAL